MKRLSVVHIVCLFYLTFSQRIDEDCNAGKGECKYLSMCPPIADNFDHIDHIDYCDDAETIVCCPKKVQPRKNTPKKDLSKISERECLAYRDRAYKNCDPQPLIVSGTKAELREFPFMALLGTEQSDKSINWFCGGTLISSKFVLSASHCFFTSDITDRVRLGELDYNSDTDGAQPQDFSIKNYVTHPDYNYTKNYNDIAVVELDKEAQINSYVVPACLPSTNGSEYTHFIAAGWGNIRTAAGVSTHLLKVKLERFEDEECKAFFELPDKLDKGLHLRTQLCAGSHNDSRDTCTGDSGGPLFIEHPEYACMYMLVGITQFGLSCGVAGLPAVYVRVSLYVDWIESIVWKAASSI